MLSAIRSGSEAIIVDSHMPNTDDVTQEQIELSLQYYLRNSNVTGFILTGFDRDHACPAGVESILTSFSPSWIMYPKYYKDSDAATEVFNIISRHEKNRSASDNPLIRVSVRVDNVESRFLEELSTQFKFELFSPHMDDMDNSNNSSIVLKLTGLDPSGFSYLITGDTESDRWENINKFFGEYLFSSILAAPHHGSQNGVNAESLLKINPNTVLISAGVDNSYGHPDSSAVRAYQSVANHVYSTNADSKGCCLFTRASGSDFETTLVRHFESEKHAII